MKARINGLLDRQYLIGKVVTLVASTPEIKKATKYLTPTTVLKVTRKHKFDGRDKNETLFVTIGGPNVREKAFIALAKQAGEPFPIRKIQFKLEK